MSTLKTENIQPTLDTNHLILRSGTGVEIMRIANNGGILIPNTTGTTFDGQVNFSNTTRFPGGTQVGGEFGSVNNTALDVVHVGTGLAIPDAVNYNTTRSRSNMMVRASGTNTTLFFGNNSSTSSWLQVQNSNNNVYGIALQPVGGNVGIGVSAPNETLHIGGNFRIGNAVMSVPTGSAPLYGVRAWVLFNSGGKVAGENITSVTRTGLGDYTFTFGIGPPTVNYCIKATHNTQDFGVSDVQLVSPSNTTNCRIIFRIGRTEVDPSYGCVMWIW